MIHPHLLQLAVLESVLENESLSKLFPEGLMILGEWHCCPPSATDPEAVFISGDTKGMSIPHVHTHLNALLAVLGIMHILHYTCLSFPLAKESHMCFVNPRLGRSSHQEMI